MEMTTWSNIITKSLQDLWQQFFVKFFPQLIIALITLIVIWLLGILLGKLVERIVTALYVDQGLEKLGMKEGMKKGGMKLNAGAFLGGLLKWFLIFVGLMAFSDILGLNDVSNFLRTDVLTFIPRIIAATVILIVSVLIANFLQQFIKGSIKAADLKASGFLSGLAKWSILVLGFGMALAQLGVNMSFLSTAFTGIIAMLSLAGGLAFGLGGKDLATEILKKMKSSL
ncbi:MAG: hypothetical protein ABII25_02580 [bacterium]